VQISRKEQINQRRQLVLKLSAQGLTQQEIAKSLEPLQISQQTVSLDLKWLRQEAIQFVKQNKGDIAVEYRKALVNFYELRKKAWTQFNKAEHDKNEDRQLSLYSIIESINANIMALLAAGDIIEKDLIEHTKQQANLISKEMITNRSEQVSGRTNQAKF